MRRVLVVCAVGMLAGFVASLAVRTSAATPVDRWVVRDLAARWSIDTPDGGVYRTPHMEINARGQILGEAQSKSGEGYTFLWQAGKTLRLPFAPGRPMPYSTDEGAFVGTPSLNDRGQIVGIVRRRGTRPFAAVWEDRKLKRVGAADGALINAGGQVVAWSNDGRWFLWENGKVRARGRMETWNWADWSDQGAIVALNDRGQIAGRGLLGAPANSWLWQKGTTTDLGTPPYGSTGARLATDLNERGQVVGFDIPNNDPFLWQNRGLRVVGGGSGETLRGQEIAINDRGQVLGSYGGGWWLWEAGKLRVKDANGSFVAINNRGQVVGVRYGRLFDAFVWVNGKWTSLPLLPGDAGAGALALNERNQIVGISCTYELEDPSGGGTLLCRAVLWTKSG